MVYGLTVSTARRRYWADLVTETGFLFFRASNLHITAASLASVAMFASMEWALPLEELWSFVLNFSGVCSHWMVLSAMSSYNNHPSSSFFFKNPPWHMDSNRVRLIF